MRRRGLCRTGGASEAVRPGNPRKRRVPPDAVPQRFSLIIPQTRRIFPQKSGFPEGGPGLAEAEGTPPSGASLRHTLAPSAKKGRGEGGGTVEGSREQRNKKAESRGKRARTGAEIPTVLLPPFPCLSLFLLLSLRSHPGRSFPRRWVSNASEQPAAQEVPPGPQPPAHQRFQPAVGLGQGFQLPL